MLCERWKRYIRTVEALHPNFENVISEFWKRYIRTLKTFLSELWKRFIPTLKTLHSNFNFENVTSELWNVISDLKSGLTSRLKSWGNEQKSGPFRVNWKKLPIVIVGPFSWREKEPTKNAWIFGLFLSFEPGLETRESGRCGCAYWWNLRLSGAVVEKELLCPINAVSQMTWRIAGHSAEHCSISETKDQQSFIQTAPGTISE